MVDEKGKRRLCLYSTYIYESEGEGVAVRPVIEATYSDQILECHLANMMLQIAKRILGPRDQFGKGNRIVIQKMDVKSAFRRVRVHPTGAVIFAYAVGCYLFIGMGSVRMKGESGVLGRNREHHSTGTAADGKGIGDDVGHGDSGLSVCVHLGVHGSRGGFDAAKLPSQGDRGGGLGGRGQRVGHVLHGSRGIGGDTVGRTREAVPSAVTVAGVDSFSGRGGESGRGGSPAVAQEGGGLAPPAGSTGY